MKRLFSPYILTLAILPLLSCATLPEKPNDTPDDFFSETTWQIQPGTRVSISVQNDPSFSKKDLTVNEDGFLSYPPLGRLKATGYTEETLKAYIANRLSADFFHNPEVSVKIDHQAKIYILGEVKNPGLFEIDHPVTVLEAVKLAGSFRDNSKRDTIRLMRQTPEGEKIKTIHLKKIDFTWIRHDKIYLMPGDLVMVN